MFNMDGFTIHGKPSYDLMHFQKENFFIIEICISHIRNTYPWNIQIFGVLDHQAA